MKHSEAKRFERIAQIQTDRVRELEQTLELIRRLIGQVARSHGGLFRCIVCETVLKIRDDSEPGHFHCSECHSIFDDFLGFSISDEQLETLRAHRDEWEQYMRDRTELDGDEHEVDLTGQYGRILEYPSAAPDEDQGGRWKITQAGRDYLDRQKQRDQGDQGGGSTA